MAENKEEVLEDILEDLEKEAEEVTEETENKEAADTSEKTEDKAENQDENSQAEENAEEEASEDGKDEKQGFFKKKKDKKDEKIEELNDKVMRQMAEFENFRKRTEKEKTQSFDMGAKSILEKFLPIVDSFERGLETVPEENKEDPFVVGMDKVYKQLLTQLEAVGVKPIEALGQELNPDLHNAVMQVESAEYESGVVAQELQKGYTYKDMVIRHSMVAVAQ